MLALSATGGAQMGIEMFWRVFTIVHNHYPTVLEAPQIRNRHNNVVLIPEPDLLGLAIGWG